MARKPPPFATSELPRRIRYSIVPNPPEPDANLPVLSRVLYARVFEWMRGVRESVLEQFGAWDQLRTAIYDRHRVICLLGHLRAKDDGSERVNAFETASMRNLCREHLDEGAAA